MTEKELCSKFATNLRKFRKQRGLTQQRLAEIANIEYKYVQRLEGKKSPAVRVDTIAKLAKALKISPYKLLL